MGMEMMKSLVVPGPQRLNFVIDLISVGITQFKVVVYRVHRECTSSLLFQSLNEIMKVDLIKDKTAAEIEQVGNLWL